jgi:RNA polymerase sigma-70 factor, ECF subfamily
MRRRGTKDDSPRALFDGLFTLAYEELRRLASTVRRGDPSQTLNTTALVNEAWLKLSRSPDFANTSTLHFKRIAARAMRQVLVEAARRRKASKRGGAGLQLVTLDEECGLAAPGAETDVLGLDAALDELRRMNPRQATLVESRFFGGLGVAEAAELLGVSEATAQRDWRASRAWLAKELRRAARSPPLA